MEDPGSQHGYSAYPRQAPGRRPGAGTVRFEAIGDAWNKLKSDLAVFLASSLLLALIVAICYSPILLVSFRMAMEGEDPNSIKAQNDLFPVALLTAFLVYISVGLMNAGILRMALLKVRGQEAGVGDIFRMNGRFGQVLLAEGILAVAGLLPTTLGQLPILTSTPTSDLMSIAIGSLVLQLGGYAILGLFQLFATFVPLLIIDKGLGVGKAFATSFSMAARHFWPLLGILILVSLIAGLGFLACGVGILFTIPIYLLTRAVVYDDLFGQPDQHAIPADFSQPPSSWSAGNPL